MGSGNSSPPAAPDYAKLYQQGIDVLLRNNPRLLDAEQQARTMYDPQRIQDQQALQDQFGANQYKQQLDALHALDPQSAEIRGKLAGLVSSDLDAGYALPADYEKELTSQIRGSQAARGNILGVSAGGAESAFKGKAALDLYQRHLENAGSFLSSPTPEQQLLAVQGVQPDRSMAYVNPGAGTAGANFGLQSFQDKLAQYQLSNGPQNNPWMRAASGAATGATVGSAAGGYGALAGALVGGAAGYFSSILVKRNITEVGKSKSGLTIIEFAYKRGRDRYRGVIAEEVKLSHPFAVGECGGVLCVDYDRIDVPFEKQCVKCRAFQNIRDFYHRKGGKDGHRSECKVCQDAKAESWKEKNPERSRKAMVARGKKWKLRNRDKYLAQSRVRDKARWPKRSKQAYDAKKKWAAENPELHRERELQKGRRYRAKYPDKVRAAGRIYDRRRKAKKTQYMRERKRSNISFRLASRLRTSLCLALDGKIKTTGALKLLGCSLADFRLYLESKFESGMNWQNYGKYGWHIDHIMPCAIFDMSKPEHQKRCFHFSNMQPMWATDNLRKSDKITTPQFQLL